MAGVLAGVLFAYLIGAAVLYQGFKRELGCSKCAALRALTWPIWVFQNKK